MNLKQYTFIKPVVVDGAPGAHTVWLKVGNQSFCLDGYKETAEEADWFRVMLETALTNLVAEATAQPQSSPA